CLRINFRIGDYKLAGCFKIDKRVAYLLYSGLTGGNITFIQEYSFNVRIIFCFLNIGKYIIKTNDFFAFDAQKTKARKRIVWRTFGYGMVKGNLQNRIGLNLHCFIAAGCDKACDKQNEYNK